MGWTNSKDARLIPRRQFLAGAGHALGTLAALPFGRVVPAVEAIPTVFHSHPEGSRTLVRFLVRNSDAPAGRMRVYDERTGRLLGTAGVIAVGGRRLVGELWLPLERPLRIRTELEYPGTQRPVRDRFTLNPTPHWTLHWLLLADPEAVRAAGGSLDPVWRSVPGASLIAAGVRLDPVRMAEPRTDLEAARIAWPASVVSHASGVPLAPIGTAQRGFAGLPQVLRGSGLVGTVGMLDEPWTMVETVPASLVELQRLVEERLAANDTAHRRGIVITPIAQETTGLTGLFEAWRTRFASPVLALGTVPDDLRMRPISMPRPPLPDGPRALGERSARRHQALAQESSALFAPLARRLGAAGDPLDTIARALRPAYAGVVVFNRTPYGRTDVVREAGGEWIATDIPGPGYAVVPTPAPATWPDGTATSTPVIANATWRLRLDTRGAVASLLHQRSGTELAGPRGLVVAPDARATAIALTRAPGLGERLIVQHAAGGMRWITIYTLYAGLDVVDIATDGGPWDHTWDFDLAVDGGRTRWAEPLGTGEAEGPMHGAAVTDWWAADGNRGAVMVATPDGGVIRRVVGGGLRYAGPDGGVRLRLGFVRTALADDPWRVGALGVPLVALPVPGAGTHNLPGFGRVLNVRDPGMRLVGLTTADDGLGVIAYLHDVMGVARRVTLGSDLHRISSAFACDLLESNHTALEVHDGYVTLDVPAGGVVAVRLIGG